MGKELRETFVCLKIIYRTKLYKSEEKINTATVENNELISIYLLKALKQLKRMKTKKKLHSFPFTSKIKYLCSLPDGKAGLFDI